MKPVVTVVIVSDYAAGESKSWADMKAALGALADQDFEEPFEVLLVEASKFQNQLPPDLTDQLPETKIMFCDETGSYELKDKGMLAAATELVAFLDADCIPEADWLRHLVGTMRERPTVAVVNGRTTYKGSTTVERTMALLSRSFVDRGDLGETRSISNNNAGYRRSILVDFPLSNTVGPFGAKLQARALMRAGHTLLFDPAVRVTHDYEGWAMERDIRRNVGYSTIAIRYVDTDIEYSWMARFGYFSVPLFFGARIFFNWWECSRLWREFGLRWYDLPAAFAITIVAIALEMPGMIDAVRKRPITETAWR